MKHTISYTKASGAGNDFVVINNMDRHLDVDYPALARALCSRPFGVGADGMLALEPSERAHFFMKYYNADGSYGGMCGNGGRCISRYAYLQGIAPENLTFEALGYVYHATISGERVKLSMKDPTGFRKEIGLHLQGRDYQAQFVDTGSPHVVFFVNDLESIDIAGVGRAARWDREFAPEGTNVNFVRKEEGSAISLRTYERGVEAETLACGTGSVASAVIAGMSFGLHSPVTVKVRSGEELLVHFKKQGDSLTDIVLEGSAHMLFSGNILYDDTSLQIYPQKVL